MDLFLALLNFLFVFLVLFFLIANLQIKIIIERICLCVGMMMMNDGVICERCNKMYKSKGSLKCHQAFYCGVAPMFPCPYCPKECNQKSNLKKHIRRNHFTPQQENFVL